MPGRDNRRGGACSRCGACCAKGGPALHYEDLRLVLEGVLRPRHLVTLRAGEFAYHPVERRLVALDGEMIKVRGRDGSPACMFLTNSLRGEAACAIYASRPLECRILTCWDTAPSERLFLQHLLERRHLCPAGSALGEVIAAHDRILAPSVLFGVLAGGSPGQDAFLELERLLASDRSFRERASAGLGIGPDELDFFFGRELGHLAAGFRELLHKK